MKTPNRYETLKAIFESRESHGERTFRLIDQAKPVQKDWEWFREEYPKRESKKDIDDGLFNDLDDFMEEFDEQFTAFMKEFTSFGLSIDLTDNSDVIVDMAEVMYMSGESNEA